MTSKSLDWRPVARARALRVAQLVAVVLAVILAATCAQAQTCTSSTWTISNGQGYSSSFDWGADGCQGFTTWATGVGWTVNSCALAANNTGMFLAPTQTSGGPFTISGFRHGCTFAAAPPSTPASAAPITATLVMPAWIDLSLEDGAELAMLIIGVWVAAAVFRWLISVVRDSGAPERE